jgi:hypothetical protein
MPLVGALLAANASLRECFGQERLERHYKGR